MSITIGRASLMITYIVMIALIIFIGISLFTGYQQHTICKPNGYDFIEPKIQSSKGYVTCCNVQYEDNLRVDDYCQAVAVD